MEFFEFKQEVIGRDDKNKTKATVGFMYIRPVESDEAPGTYELSLEDMVTINKPEIDLIYISEPLTSLEFIRLNLKFISSYDQDISELYSFLKKYEKEASDYYDNYEKCPAMTVNVIPNNIYESENDVNYLEMNMPIMISLVSSRPSNLPDTISMLFTVDNCAMIEDESVDLNEIKREDFIEKENEKRDEELRIEEEKRELEKQQKMAELQKQLNETDMNDKRIFVGRSYHDENSEMQ